MFVEQYQRLQANPPSDLVADIVADYEVSDAEFAEAQQAFKECVSSHVPGSNPQAYADGSTEVSLPDTYVAQFGDGADAEEAANNALGEVADACGNESIYEVAFLYLEPKTNPWGYRNLPEALRACLKGAGSDFGAGLSDEELADAVSVEDFVAPDASVAACVEDPLAALKAMGE